MHTDIQVVNVTEPVEAETIDAELVESPRIRRAPSAELKPSGAKITMTLTDWLDVDQKLWELYNLCEIAILQRDEARDGAHELELEYELMAARLREWKAYARGLEQRLHQAQLDNLELTFGIRAMAEVANDAIETSPFARGQKRRLRSRLAEIGEQIG